ncbi:MAG: hypothetical protein ACRDA3_09230 [Peptostreptococcaceae bacterium]
MILTLSPFIHLSSSINNIYQSIAKQMATTIILSIIISAYYIVTRGIRINKFIKFTYLILILCTVSSIKYCIDIYDTPFLGIKLSDIILYRNRSKTSYYELDLSNKVKTSKCTLYTPTSSTDGKCVIYLNNKGEDISLNTVLFYKDIAIDEGNSFMILDINNNDINESIDSVEKTIEQLKEDNTIKEAILMVEEKNKEDNLLKEVLMSNSIDGVIELSTKDKFKIKDIEIKNMPILVLQGNDNFIRTSIIGDKFEKTFEEWISSDF